jgi:integrase
MATHKPSSGHATDLTQKSLALAIAQQKGSPRNSAMLLCSCGAGLRAKEIAALRWEMVLTEDGTIGNAINLPHHASKGRSGGVIPLAKNVRAALEQLKIHTETKKPVSPEDHIFISQKTRKGITNQAVIDMFRRIWRKAGIDASSHSGRRWFATNAARQVSTVGGSLRDVQMLLRHSSLQTTQRYISPNTKAQVELVNLVSRGIR